MSAERSWRAITATILNRRQRRALSRMVVLIVMFSGCANIEKTDVKGPGGVADTNSTAATTTTIDNTKKSDSQYVKPSASELASAVPSLSTLNQLSTGAGKDYKKVSEQPISNGAKKFLWAKGLSYGYETRMELQSVNEIDMMKLHTAKAVFRTLVFDTQEAAASAVGAYLRSMDRAKSQVGVNDDKSRWASLRYDDSSRRLPRISEGICQKGMVITWVVYEDNVSLSWEPQAVALAEWQMNALL